MSLEQALADNTAAINALIGVLSSSGAALGNVPVQAREPAPGQATAKASAAPKKTAAEPTPTAQSAAAASQASTAATTEGNVTPAATSTASPIASSASSSEAASSVDYPTLQKAVFALAGKSREAAAAVAASMGVKTFKDLPEAKWADALAAVNAKLAELEAA